MIKTSFMKELNLKKISKLGGRIGKYPVSFAEIKV